MKEVISTWLQRILILIIVLLFLVKISDNVEKYIFKSPSEKCWYTFFTILFIIGVIYYFFYTMFWQRCVRYVQKCIFNYFSVKLPYII